MFKKWIDDWRGRFPPIRKRNEAQAAKELRQMEIARLDVEAEQEAHAKIGERLVGERLAEWKEQTKQAEWICSRCKRSVTKADWIYLKNYNLWQCRTDHCGNVKKEASGQAFTPRPDPDAPTNPYSE